MKVFLYFYKIYLSYNIWLLNKKTCNKLIRLLFYCRMFYFIYFMFYLTKYIRIFWKRKHILLFKVINILICD